MPNIMIYSKDLSSASQIVRLTMTEMGLPYSVVEVELLDYVHYEPWYAKINPSLQVPTLKYNDETLYDSKDIIKELTERHPDKSLMPKDEETKKQVKDFIETYYGIQPNITGFTFNQPSTAEPVLMKKPRTIVSGTKALQKLSKNPEFKTIAKKKRETLRKAQKKIFDVDVEVHNNKIREVLEKMEKMLSDEREFLCGKEYTLADVLGTVLCSRVYFKKENKMFPPNVKRYWESMWTRDSFQKADIICKITDTAYFKKYS